MDFSWTEEAAAALIAATEYHISAVNSTQRLESSLALNLHLHSSYLDGI